MQQTKAMAKRRTAKLILRKLSLVIAVGMAVGAGASAAWADDAGQRIFRIPGTNYDVALGEVAQQPSAVLGQPLLSAIAVWLSAEFGLSTIQRYPEIAIVPSDVIIRCDTRVYCHRRPTRWQPAPRWRGRKRMTPWRSIRIASKRFIWPKAGAGARPGAFLFWSTKWCIIFRMCWASNMNVRKSGKSWPTGPRIV